MLGVRPGHRNLPCILGREGKLPSFYLNDLQSAEVHGVPVLMSLRPTCQYCAVEIAVGFRQPLTREALPG
jgi:hypothetical protein